MTLYEINAEMLKLIDPETGELLDYEAFEALALKKDEKLENIGLWIKDLRAEASALKAEKEALAKRQKSAENKAERLAEYLKVMLDGQKFKTARLSVTYRTSKAVETDDAFLAWAMQNGEEYLNYKTPDINKTALKDALKNGVEIPHAELVERSNIQIS